MRHSGTVGSQRAPDLVAPIMLAGTAVRVGRRLVARRCRDADAGVGDA
jgi:hypothetical protein